jgi:hypothetical protein
MCETKGDIQLCVYVHFVCVRESGKQTIRSAYFGRQHNVCGHPDSSVPRTLSAQAAIRIHAC